MVFVLAGALAILSIWALLDPFIGLLALVAVNTVRPGELYPVFNTLHVERIFAILVLLSFAAHRCPISFRAPTKALLAFWGALLLGIPFAFWPGGAFSNWLDFGRIVVYFILIANLVNTPKRFRLFLTVYSGLIGWLAVSSLVLYFQGKSEVRMGIQRAVGLTSNADDANALGLTLVALLPFLFLLVQKEDEPGKYEKWRRGLMIGLAAICLCTIILTGSRSAFFTMLFMGFLFALTRRRALLYLCLASVLVSAAWFAIPEQYQNRYRTVENLQADESYQGRVTAWSFAWQLFLHHPITGAGIGMFPQARGVQTGHWLNVHSLFFQILSETGLLGAITFGYFLIATYRKNRSLRRKMLKRKNVPAWLHGFPLACNLSLAALLFAGWGAHSLYRDTWYLLAGLSAALSGTLFNLPALKRRKKVSSAEQLGSVLRPIMN